MENDDFLQYEIWKDCKNGCKFCTNFKQKDIDKISSLKYILTDLDLRKNDKIADIGFIGGEFFDDQLNNQEVRMLFYQLFDWCEQKLKNNTLKRVFITSCLIFDIQNSLIPFLDYLRDKNILDKVMLCTSYDIKYRFYTEKRKKLWEDNMLFLHESYPELKIHTQTIMTQFFIDAVLNNEFDIKAFCEKYHTFIDYNEPQSGFFYDKQGMYKAIPDFFPTKESFSKFLLKTVIQDRVINPSTFLIRDLHCSELDYIYDGERKKLFNRRNKENYYLTPGQKNSNELGFIDSDIKMADLAQEILESFGEFE